MNEPKAAPDPPWLQARKPRASTRTPLSRDAIVDAALRLLDRDGLEGVSMRRVAQALGTSAGSLYWHVPNKHVLLQLVLDRVAGEIELPARDSENWQEQAKQVAREMRRVMTSHGDIARVTLGTIPVGPNMLRVMEWVHALLREAGLPDRVVALVGDLFGLYVGAYAYEESLGLTSPTGEDLTPDQIVAMLQDYWSSLPPAQFPHTLALTDKLFAGSQDERFEFGLDVLVRGLEAYANLDPGRIRDTAE